MNNELTHYQLLLLGNTTGGTGRIDIKVKGDSLYRKIYWCHLNGGKRIRGWLPILTYDGKDWIGYNYSARDMASELLDKEYMFREGMVVEIPVGTKHRVRNDFDKNLIFIETQTGTYFGEDDIVRLEDDYGRNK